MKELTFRLNSEYNTGKLLGTGFFTRAYELTQENKTIDDLVVVYTKCPLKEVNFINDNSNPLLPVVHRRWYNDEDILKPFHLLYQPRRANYEFILLMERMPKFKKSKLNNPSKVFLKDLIAFQEKFVELIEKQKQKLAQEYQQKHGKYVCTSNFNKHIYNFSSSILSETIEYSRDNIFNTVLNTAEEQEKYEHFIEYFIDYCTDLCSYDSVHIEPITRRNLSYRNGDIVLMDIVYSMSELHK